MDEKKEVSIIIPVYKVPEIYLRRCIESVLNQTYKNIEIIIVDDGSPDDCGKICDDYARKDKRIKVIHQRNKGLSGARNTGVKNAKSEWIMFVDGDDYLEFNACEVALRNSNSNIDILCFGRFRDNDGRKEKVTSKLFENNKEYKTKEELNYIQSMILKYNANLSSAYGKLIRRNLIVQNDIFHDEKLKQGAEGIEFNIRLFGKAKSIKCLDEYLYNYVYNSKSISAMPTEENNYMVLNCFRKIKTEIDMYDKEFEYWYHNRLLYVIVTTVISSYFNPKNQINYKERKRKTKVFLKSDIIDESFKIRYFRTLDLKRKIILYFLKLKLFFLIFLIAKLK